MKFIITFSILVLSVLITLTTAAKPPSKAPPQKKQDCNTFKKPMTVDQKKLIISLHNEIRNKIALKSDKNAKLPFASNMIQMYWSEELALKAQDHANKCTKNYSDQKFRTNPKFISGENVFFVETKGGQPQPDWNKAVTHWANFGKAAPPSRIEKFNYAGYNISPFTQIIWAKSYLVGCGFSVSKTDQGDLSLYVCHYGPTGNIAGQPVYQASNQKSCNCLKGLSCGNPKWPGLCCPDGFCKDQNYTYPNGNMIPGTIR